MTTPIAAAIYARISSDPDGQRLGVNRQLEDCRGLATKRGWIVAHEYVDNDVSAYSGKGRPEYERMVEAIAAGLHDAVVVYNLDRLTRRPVELEHFADVCAAAGLTELATVTSDIDLSTDDGMFTARIFAAFGAKESARKSARVRRKNDERALAGRPHGGGPRAYGYAEDRVTVVPEEAAVIRESAERILSGESLRSITRDLERRGISTVKGNPWKTVTLRQLVTSPRVAGLREHRGEIVGQASWEPILSPGVRDQLNATLDARRVSGRRAPRRYLLSGMLRCGRCGNRMYSNPRKGVRRYSCLSHPDHGGGCGKIVVAAEPLELLIVEAVLTRLDSPQVDDALQGLASADQQTAATAEQVATDRQQLDELALMYANKEITPREWMNARNPIQERIRINERRIAEATRSTALTGLVGQGSSLRQVWSGLDLGQQVAVVSALLDHAVILPGTPGARSLDPNRVEPVWLL